MKKILVPMDFSGEAINAMEVAVSLARKSGAKILLPHIIEIPGHFYHATGKFRGTEAEELYVKELMSHFNERLKELKEDRNYNDVIMEHQIEIGSTSPSLVKMVEHSKADLVVMGSRGMEELEELFLGSTSQRMIRYANCPVLTIKNYVDIDSIRDVVFATDCESTPLYVTSEIQLLTKFLGAKLHILRVITKADWKTNREVEGQINSFAELHNITDYQPQVYYDESVLEGIVHYSEDKETDMIAVMTHGKTGLAHLIRGSIAEKLVGHSDLPVWTCRFDVDKIRYKLR